MVCLYNGNRRSDRFAAGDLGGKTWSGVRVPVGYAYARLVPFF